MVDLSKVMVKEQNLTVWIIHEKCSRCVEFVPRAVVVDHPLFGILSQPKCVMKMDNHTWL